MNIRAKRLSRWTQATWLVGALLVLSACNTGTTDNELSSATQNGQVTPAGTGGNNLNTGGSTTVAPVTIRRCAPDSAAARLKSNQGGSCAKGGV